ncbi:sperm acrosome associated 6 isoform X2 [Syngnathoides biaculeatus]|nr:sperm acrosome associated 6 isoform X2 [Syngnathoides biaculeatus]XP_061676245.1 sperm acrosome associated 6 isoform X2 [Syngnathoides biaculeatus]XP_061676246.1 sperm acrosome associated 6 isoform X2 [Syngnathoides biaculeatus]XP_061676247.1 sperm acrosome associated 6 isoform X2 [Syngnathoides biaculeatus]XP_061676248.1 sperm acrosome associated 6 isoform X2 [Syngnathoides biaculeatus]XP_061676249.1 sperm acrosome associated 6 isoform X2 [Syngnathoides biaculeatus]XP_061676250.1 sperm ac
MDDCFETLDRLFNFNAKVIEAGRVGLGYKDRLKDVMQAAIRPVMNELGGKTNPDTVYESKLQTAADNFIAAASKVPRATRCVPPCGFQTQDGHYDCEKCIYDSCNFPLDCPVEKLPVDENDPTQMSCDVSFPLPADAKLLWSWKFAEQVETRQVELFEEMTIGEDNLYSISSTKTHHQGTYQCEIYSGKLSVVRKYYYLAVTPHVVVGHSELQETFELSLLPGGRLRTGSPVPSPLPPRVLIGICFTSLLLLLIFALGVVLSWKKRAAERTGRNEES